MANGDDYGNRIVDEELEDLEERITALYANANNQMNAKITDYMEQFEKDDEKMKKQLSYGLIDEDEYIAWRKDTLLQTKQWTALREQLTQDLVSTDLIASQMINNEVPTVYENAFNFATFMGETYAEVAGIDVSPFTIYNRDAVAYLMKEDPDLLPLLDPNIPKDRRWNRQHINTAVAQGILQGESMDKIAKRLEEVVGMDENGAIRNARTCVISAQNKGRYDSIDRCKKAGIPIEKTWRAILDSRTRDSHLLLHNTHPNEKGLFGVGILKIPMKYPSDPDGAPEDRYNCRCRLSGVLEGIDHNKDDELYEKMMKEEFYDDWLAMKQRENEELQGKYGKAWEKKLALERRAELEAGLKEKSIANVKKEAVKWQFSLTPEESRSIMDYTGLGYEDINDRLRYGNYSLRNPNVDDDIKNLDSAIVKFYMPNDVTVFRKFEIDDIKDLENGFHDKGFVSTSLDKDVAKGIQGNCLLEIDVPKGKGVGMYIESLTSSEGEEEVLLARGSVFDVESIKEFDDGTYYVKLKWKGVDLDDQEI